MPSPPAKPPLTCTACGYDLAGLALPGKCPECGAENTGFRTTASPEEQDALRQVRIIRSGWMAIAAGVIAANLIVDSSLGRGLDNSYKDGLGIAALMVFLSMPLICVLTAWYRLYRSALTMVVLAVLALITTPPYTIS